MSTLRTRGTPRAGSARARPAPRFANRRARSWPCPSPARFSILYVYDLHDIVLQLSGDLDEVNVPGFGRCVAEAISEHPRRLIVEMSALETIDEPGLNGLVDARDRAVTANVELVLDSPSSSITEMLDGARLREGFFIR